MKDRYDIYIHNALYVTHYTNGGARRFVEELLNKFGSDYKKEDFRVEKNGHPLTIDIIQKVSIGGQ